MSEWDDNSNDNNGTDNNGGGGGGLRKQLETALAEIKQLKTTNETLQKEARTSKVQDFVTAKGLDKKVANIVPADVKTEEDFAKWFEEYGSIFSVKQEDQAPQNDSGDASGDAEGFEAAQEYIAMARQMGNVTSALLPPEKAKTLISEINSAEMTPEKLVALINAHGGGVGMG